MTEPHAGADPTLFVTRAERDGDEWVINGEKWFSSNARFAEFLIVMAVTNPDGQRLPGHVDVHRAGRHAGREHRPQRRHRHRVARGRGTHGYIRYDDVRVPADHLLGEEGRRSPSPRPASAAAASTTPCAPSPVVGRPST